MTRTDPAAGTVSAREMALEWEAATAAALAREKAWGTGGGVFNAGTGGYGYPACIYCPQAAVFRRSRESEISGHGHAGRDHHAGRQGHRHSSAERPRSGPGRKSDRSGTHLAFPAGRGTGRQARAGAADDRSNVSTSTDPISHPQYPFVGSRSSLSPAFTFRNPSRSSASTHLLAMSAMKISPTLLHVALPYRGRDWSVAPRADAQEWFGAVCRARHSFGRGGRAGALVSILLAEQELRGN